MQTADEDEWRTHRTTLEMSLARAAQYLLVLSNTPSELERPAASISSSSSAIEELSAFWSCTFGCIRDTHIFSESQCSINSKIWAEQIHHNNNKNEERMML
jgi:hypothetical protein